MILEIEPGAYSRRADTLLTDVLSTLGFVSKLILLIAVASVALSVPLWGTVHVYKTEVIGNDGSYFVSPGPAKLCQHRSCEGEA